MHVIIAYDISDYRLRHKIFSLLKEKGAHSQKSVFECEMDKAELDALRRSLQQLDLGANDSIVFYPLCRRCARQGHILGQGLSLLQTDWMIM